MKLRNMFSTKRRIATVAVSGAVLAAGAGIAVAVFTTSGTGVGAGHVGSVPAGLTVSPVTAAGTLTPPKATITGPAKQTLTYTVHNISNKAVTLTSGVATIDHTGPTAITGDGGPYGKGNKIPGCKYYWFTITGPVTFTSTHLKSTGAGTTKTDARVPLAMPYNAATQNACATSHPEVTLTVKAS